MHPRFDQVLEALTPYKKLHPTCKFIVVTNGYGKRVQGILSRLPDWTFVINSGKTSNEHAFQSFSVAPIDSERFRNSDFSRGCFVTEYCGLSLTKNGYYCCCAGSTVDRIFGFDIGLKSLSLMTDSALKNQFTRLCRYCGHFKYNYSEALVSTEEISPSWHDAFARYRKERPTLTPY